MVMGMRGKVSAMAGIANAAASRHEDCFAIGIDIASLQRTIAFMTGRTGIMDLVGCRIERHPGSSAGGSSVTGVTVGRGRNQVRMFGPRTGGVMAIEESAMTGRTRAAAVIAAGAAGRHVWCLAIGRLQRTVGVMTSSA